MYGYLKLDSYCPDDIKKAYKKYYCYVCRNLEAHYGFKSRFILSYDVTLFLLCVTSHEYLENIEKIKCFNKEAKITYTYEYSKRIAALSLLLVYYKIKDDLNDENSFKAKLSYFIYKRMIKKAQKEFPMMDEIIASHYCKISILEEKNSSLNEIGLEFSLLLTELAEKCFDLKDESKKSCLRYFGRWVYFIDAVDDLDKDIKKNRFNPLKNIATSLSQLVNEKYLVFKENIDLLNKDLENIKLSNSINDKIIKRLIFYSIPDTTFRIIKG